METDALSPEEQRILLQIARRSIEDVVAGRSTPPDLETLPPRLREDGVTFVTLTMPDGALRGCIGGLEATQPLAMDVYEHAAAAAREDYRFEPVHASEIPLLHIEISRLTPPVRLDYDRPEDLPKLLHPYVDGVVLRDGMARATFLPQVWDKISDPAEFLSHLCRKMGAPADLWRRKKMRLEIYHVEEFHEA